MNKLFTLRAPDRSEMGKVQDIKLCARSVHEAAIAYQSIPNYPDCEHARESAKRIYEQALAELLEAIR